MKSPQSQKITFKTGKLEPSYTFMNKIDSFFFSVKIVALLVLFATVVATTQSLNAVFQNISSWTWRDGSVSKTLAAKCEVQSSDPQNTCKCQVGMVDRLLCPLAGSRKEK